MLYDTPSNTLDKLQYIQKSAFHLLTHALILQNLHRFLVPLLIHNQAPCFNLQTCSILQPPPLQTPFYKTFKVSLSV